MQLRQARPRTAKNSSGFFDKLQSHRSSAAHDNTTYDRTEFALGSSHAKRTTLVDIGDLLRVDSADLNNQLSLIALI